MKYRLALFSGASVLKYSVHNHNLHYGIRECLHPIKDVTTNVKVSTFLRVILLLGLTNMATDRVDKLIVNVLSPVPVLGNLGTHLYPRPC